MWLVDSVKRTVTIYRLEEGRYGDAIILKLKGRTPVNAGQGVTIDWDALLARID